MGDRLRRLPKSDGLAAGPLGGGRVRDDPPVPFHLYPMEGDPTAGAGPPLPLDSCLLSTSLDEIDVWSVGLEGSLNVPQLSIEVLDRAGDVEPA